jgi:hypothetical protein
MRTLCLALCGALIMFAAGDPWAKVKEVKGGTELRVYKKGSAQPLLVKMDEATDERLVIVNKNEQTSIAREDIDRIDARRSSKRTITKETKQTISDSNADPRSAIPGPPTIRPGPTNSTSTSYSVGEKPDFETVYRRPPAALKK